MKVGVIDIGGGMRDIYGAGVLDRCMQDGVRFDCCIGVSAGSANLITYLAGQRGRNYRFYSVYSKRRQFMSLGNFLKNGSYFNFDYVYCGVGNSDGEDPLDHDAFMQSSADFFVVALNADTGQPHYFTKADFTRDNYQPLSASSCIPALNRPVVLGGTRYFDGGLADPMPVEKALAEGCDKVILLLTHPVEHYMKAEPMPRIARLFAKKYPAAAPRIANWPLLARDQLLAALQYADQGKVLIIAPRSTEGVSAISKNQPAMDRLYQQGLQDGAAVARWLGETSAE